MNLKEVQAQVQIKKFLLDLKTFNLFSSSQKTWMAN